MHLEELSIPGVFLVRPEPFRDDRGFFVRTMDADAFAAVGVDVSRWVQANQSRSRGGVVRGLHVRSHGGEAKTVRCARGAIFDVAVDLRPGSPAFGRWLGVRLDDVDHHQLYLPPGVGHGFAALTDPVDVCYTHSARYDPAEEVAVRWDDPDIGVDWPVSDAPILSDRDRSAPSLQEMTPFLTEWFGGPA